MGGHSVVHGVSLGAMWGAWLLWVGVVGLHGMAVCIGVCFVYAAGLTRGKDWGTTCVIQREGQWREDRQLSI